MKKRNISRALSMLLAALLAFGMIFVNTGQAKAASKWVIGLPDVLWAGQHSSGGDFNFVSVWNEGKTATVTSVKSSNPKVLKVEKERWENEKGKMQDYYYLIPKTAGKATLTVKYTTPGGKHKTDKKTIRVKKYPYEIKRLKVNGKKISISKNKYRYEKGKITSKLVDVDLKLKKGWQITDVRGFCWNMNSNDELEIRNAKSLIKKGKAIKFPKKYSEFELIIDMTNGNDFINYHIRLSRNSNV